MSVSKKDIKDISDLIRKKLELYMNVERRESRFDPRGKFTTTPKMHKYDFLYKVLDASVLDAEGRKARQAKGENARPKSSVHSPERAKSAKRSSDRAKSSLVRSSHSPRRDRRQNRRVISPSNEKRRRVDEGSKSGSRKRDGGDRAGRSYPRSDANMDESSIVSDSVQTNASSSVHSRVSSNGIKPKLEDSPSRVVLHREKERLSSYASKIFSEVPVDEIQLIHRYRPSYEDNGEPKYQGFSRHVGSILKSKNFVHFYNNEALHHSVDKENSESRDRLTSSKKPSRMANRAIKSAYVTKGHDDVIRTAKSSRHTVFSSLIDTAGTGTRLVKATSKEFAASSIESLTPTYTSSFHNIETSTFPQSHDPYRPSDANRPPSPADHFRHGRSVSIASIKSSVTVHFNENKLDEKNRSVSFPVIKQPQERRITEDESSDRMREPNKRKEFTEYYEDPNTKVKVDREKSNVEITKRETVEKDEQVYKIKQIVVVSVDDKKQTENDKMSDTEVSESHEISDKEYSESYDATESVNQKSDEEGSERTLSPISDTELTDTAEKEEKKVTVVEGEKAQLVTDNKLKEEKSVTIGDVEIMNAKRHGHLKPLMKSPSPDMAKNKRRRKRSERDKTDKTNNETVSTERGKGTSDTEKQKQEFVEGNLSKDLEKKAQGVDTKEVNSIIDGSAVPCTIAKDIEGGAGHSPKTVDDKHKEVVESKTTAKDEKEVSVSDSEVKIEKSEVNLNVSENRDDYEDDFEEEDINLSSREESPRKEDQPLATTEKIDVSESTNKQQKTDGASVDKENNEGISMNEPEDDKAGQTKLAVNSDESHTTEKPEENLSDVTVPQKRKDKSSTEVKPEETILEIKQCQNSEETAEIESKTLENKEREDKSFVALPVPVSRPEKIEEPDYIRFGISEISQARKEIVSVNHEAIKENNLHGLHISNSSINTLIISRDHGNQGERETKDNTKALIGKETVLVSKDNARIECEDDTSNINVESSNSKDIQSTLPSRNESLATQTISSQATQTINSVQIQTISDMQTQTIESTSTQTTIAAESQTDKQRRFSVSSVDSYQVAEYAKENACQIDMVDIATSPIPETLFVLSRHIHLPPEEIKTDSSVTIIAEEERAEVTVDDERKEESKSKQVAENDYAQNISNKTDYHLQEEKEIENNKAHTLVSDKLLLGSRENLSSSNSNAKMRNNISKDKSGEIASELNICDRNKESINHLPKEVEKNEFSKHITQYKNNDLFSKNEVGKDDELLPDMSSEEKINTEDEISTNVQEDTHKLDSEIIVGKAETEKEEDTLEDKNQISDEARDDQKQVVIITKPETVFKEIGEMTTDDLIQGEPDNQSNEFHEGSDKMVDDVTQEDVKEIPKEDKAFANDKREEHADTHMSEIQRDVEEITADNQIRMNQDVAEKEKEEVLETQDVHGETAVTDLEHKQETKENQSDEQEDENQAMINTEISEKSGSSDRHDLNLEDRVDTLDEKNEKADLIKEEKHQNEEISNHNLQFQTENNVNELDQIMEGISDEKRTTGGDSKNVRDENTESYTDEHNEKIGSEFQQELEAEEVKDENQDSEKEKNDISILKEPDEVNHQIQDVSNDNQFNNEDGHIEKGTQGKDDTDEKQDCFRAIVVEQERCFKETDSCANTDRVQESLDINIEETTSEEEKLLDFKTEETQEIVNSSNESENTQFANEIERGGQNELEIQKKEDSKEIGDLSQVFENTEDEKEQLADHSKQDQDESSGKVHDIKDFKVESHEDETENKSDSREHDKHESEEVFALKVKEEDRKQTSVEEVSIDSKVQEQPSAVDDKQQIIETDKLGERDDQVTDVLLRDKLKTDANDENVMSETEAVEQDTQIKTEILSEIGDQKMEDVVKYQNITEEQADSKVELKEEIKVSGDKIQDEIMIKHSFEEEETFDSEIQQQLPETREIIKDSQSVLDKDGSAETTIQSVLLEKAEKTNKTAEKQLKEADELVNEQKESFDTKTQDKTDNEAALHDGNEKLNKKIIHPAIEKPETDNKADEENLKDVKEFMNEQMESFETKTIEKQDNEAAPHCGIEQVDKKLIHPALEKPETTNKLDIEQLIDPKINEADEEQIKDVDEHVNEQEESFKAKSHEKQENESAQYDDNEKVDKKLIYPEDENTNLSSQQKISREQMNNAQSDIQAEEGSKQKQEHRITELSEEIPNNTESEQEQVEIQTTAKAEGKENEKESQEYDIDINEKHIDSTLQGKQEKEKREYEEMTVVIDEKSDKQAEYSELLRKETQETVETECENKYEKTNEQCQIDELTHATFGEKLDNEEKTIETKPFVNEKVTDEQDLQNDTVSKENLEVVDIFNLQKEAKIEEKNDPEEVQIDSNFLEKTENIQPRGERQNDKVDIQVHTEETGICFIMERKLDVENEKDKGLDKIEKGNDENKAQVKLKIEEKQEPQQSSNQEIHDEAECEQQEMNKDLAQKLEAENDDKGIERENREKHIDFTQPDDIERTFEGQSKERDWHTEKQAEKNELGKKDTQESVEREPENKDIETDNQSYKNEHCYSGLEHELDKEERSLVVETLKVDTQTDEQQLLVDTEVNETVEISIHKNFQNVEGQSSNEEVLTYSGLHETKEILEKKRESLDIANDIQAHDNEKSTDSAVQGNAIPEKCDDNEICNIEKGNKEDDEKKPKTEEPKETIQSDNLNLDIHNETPSQQKRIKTDFTETLEVKEKEIDIKLKTENEETRIESKCQGEQHTGTVHDIGKGKQEEKNKEQIVLADELTDKQADIEIEEEKIDPTLQEKTTLSVQNYEGSDTTIVKPEDEIEKLKDESAFQGKTSSIEEKGEGSQVKEESDKHVDKNISERKEARVIDNNSILVNDDKQNDAVQKQVDNQIAEKQDGEMNKEIKDVLAVDDTSNGKEPIDLIKGTTAKNEGNNDKFEVVQTEDGNERHKEAFDIRAMHKLMTEENVNQNQLVESLKGKEEDRKSPDHQDGVETVKTHDNEQNIDLKKQNTEVEKQLKTEEGDDKNESLSRIQTNFNEETEEKSHKTSIMEVQLHEHKDPKEMCANDSNNPTVEADSMSSTAQKPSELKLGSGDTTGVEEEEGQSADKIYAVSGCNLDSTSGEEISDTFYEDREKGVNESNTERRVKENDICLQHLETTDAKESRQTTGDEGNKHSDHEDCKPHTDLDLASKGLDEKVNTEKESQKPIESGKVGHSETDVDMDSSKTSTQTHINIPIENNLENAEKDNELEVLDKNQEHDGKNIHYYSPASEPLESIPAIIPAYLGPDINESCIEMASLGSDSTRNLLSVPEREILKNTTDMDKSFNADVASHGDNSCKIGVPASEKTDIKANTSEFFEHLKMEERNKTDTEQFSEKTFHLNSNDQDLIEQNMSEKHTPTAMPDINKITEFIETKHKTNDDTESEVQVTVKEESKSDTREQAGMKTGEESKETEEVTNDSSNQRTDMLEDTQDVQSHLNELSDNSHSYEITFVPEEETSVEKSQTETTDKSASLESDSSHEPSLEVINESHSEHNINTDSSKILLEQVVDEKHNEVKSIHQKSQETTNEVLDQQLKIDQLSSEIIQEDVDADENIDTSDSINVAEETGETLKEDNVNEKKSTSKKEIDLSEHLDSNVCESNESTNSTFSQLQHALTGRKKDDTTAEKDLNIIKAELDNVCKDSGEQTIVVAGSRKIDIANDGIQSTYLFSGDTGVTLEKIVNKEEDLDKKMENQSSIRTTISDKNAHDEEGSLLSVEEGKPYQDKKNIENGHNEKKKTSQDIKILIKNAMGDSKSTETHSSSTPSSNGMYTATSEPSSSTETTSTSVLESLDESELDSTMETEIKNEKPVDYTLIVQEKQDPKVELNDKKSCTPVYTSSLSDTSVLDETVENEISRATQVQKCVDESQSGSNSISGTSTISQTPKELVVDTMKTYTSVTEIMSEQSDHKDKILSVVKDDKEDTNPINETEPISLDDKNNEQASLNTKEKTSSATEARPVNIEGYQTGESKEKLSENECSKEVSERNETSFSEEDTFTSVSKFTSSSRFTETILLDDSEQDEIIRIDGNGEEKDSKNLLLSIKERDSAQKENCLSEDLIIGETGRKLEDKPTLNGEHIEDNAELLLNSGISDSFGSETKDRDNGTVDTYNQDTSQGITDISEASLETNDDENNDSKMPRKRAESGMSQILMETTITSLEKTDDSSTEAQTIDIPKRADEQIDVASANVTTSEQRKEKKETLTTHQSEIKGEDNSTDKQALSSIEAQLELDRVELKVLSDKQARTKTSSEMKTTPESSNELKDEDSAIQQAENISESADSKVADESSSDVKNLPNKMASNETTTETPPTHESSSEFKDAELIHDQCATNPDYTCVTYTDESTSTIQMDISDTKNIPDKVTPKDTSEMSPTSISTNLLKDAKFALDHSATNSASTYPMYSDESTSAVQLGKSDAILESDPTTESSKELKNAKVVMDVDVSGAESSGNTTIDESISETKLDCSGVKDVESSNLLKTSEWNIDQSTLKQEHTDSIDNNESTIKIQMDGSDITDLSDMLTSNETRPERKPISDSSDELKEAESNVDQTKMKPESNGKEGINDSTCNVKELLHVHVETKAPSIMEPKPQSYDMKNKDSVADKNLNESECTVTKDIDKSTFDIHVDGSDATDLYQKQAPTDTRAELTDAKAVKAKGLMKLDAIGLNDTDESLSNVKDVLDKLTSIDTVSVTQPILEQSYLVNDKQLVKHESALKAESTRATDIDDYISKTQLDGSDFEDKADKSSSKETPLEIKHSLEISNRLKDEEFEIDQSASEITSSGLKNVDKSISNVENLPSEQAPTETRAKIESSLEPSNELKDAEPVLDQSATKLKSTTTTLIGEYSSKNLLDASDVKDEPKKHILTQEPSDLLQKPESSDKLKDAKPVIDQSVMGKESTGKTYKAVSDGSKESDESTSCLKDVSDEKAHTETTTEVGSTAELCEGLRDRESVVDQSSIKAGYTGPKDIDNSTSIVQFKEPELSGVPNKEAQSEEMSETISTQESSEYKDSELVINNRATKIEFSETIAIDASSSSIQLDGSDEKNVFDSQSQNEAITETLPLQEPNKVKEAEYLSSLKQETIESAIIFNSTGSNDIDESTPDLKQVIEELVQIEAKSEMEPILESCHKLKDVESVNLQSTTKEESTGPKVIGESTGSKYIDETTSDVAGVPHQQAPTQVTSELQQTPQTFERAKDRETVGNQNTAKPASSDLKIREQSVSKIQLEGSVVEHILDENASTAEISQMESTPKAFYEFKVAESVSGQSATNSGSIDLKDIDESTSNLKDTPDEDVPVHSTKVFESTFAEKVNGSDVKEIPGKIESTVAPSGMLSTPEILHKLKDAESITDESAFKHQSSYSTAIVESTGSKDIDEQSSDLKESPDEQFGLSPESCKEMKDEESVVDQEATNAKDNDESTSNIHFETSGLNNEPDKQVPSDAKSELQLTQESAHQLKDAVSFLGENKSELETTDSTVIDECKGLKELGESLSGLKEVSDDQTQTETKSEVESTTQKCDKLKDEDTVVDQSTTKQKSSRSKDIDESPSKMELMGSNVNNVPERQTQKKAASDIETIPKSIGQLINANSLTNQSMFRPESNDSTVIGEKDMDESSSDLIQVSDEQAKPEAKSQVEPKSESYNNLEDKQSIDNQSTTNLESVCSTDIDKTKSNMQLEGSDVNNVPDKQDQTEATPEMETTSIMAFQFQDANLVIDQNTSKSDSVDSTDLDESTGSKDTDASSSDLREISDTKAQTETKSELEPTPETCNKLQDKESVENKSTTDQKSPCSTDIDETTFNMQSEGSNVDKVPDTHAKTETTPEMGSTPIISDQFKDGNFVIDQSSLKPVSNDSIVIGKSTGLKDIDESSSDLKEIPDEQAQTETKSEFESTPESYKMFENEESFLDLRTSNQDSTGSKNIDESISKRQSKESNVSHTPEKQAQADGKSEMENTSIETYQCKDVDSVIDQCALKPDSSDFRVISETSYLKDIDEPSLDLKDISDEQTKTESKPQVKESVDSQSSTNLESSCSKDIDDSTTSKQLGGSNFDNILDKQALSEATEIVSTSIISNKCKDVESVVDQVTLESDSTNSTVIDSKIIDETSSDLKKICNEGVQSDTKSEIEPTPETCNKMNDKELERNKSETNLESTFSKDIDESTSNIHLDGSIVKEVPEKLAPAEESSEMEPAPESANKFKDADSVINESVSRPESTDSTVVAKSTSSKDIDEQSSDMNQVSDEQAKTEAKPDVEPRPESWNKLNDEELVDGQSIPNKNSTCSTDIDESTTVIQLGGSNVNNVPDKPAQTEATSDMETTSVEANQVKDVNSVIDKHTLKPDSTDPKVTGESIDSEDIDESSSDLKEICDEQAQTDKKSEIELTPETCPKLNKVELERNKSETNLESTFSKDIDESISNIQLDGSIVKEVPDMPATSGGTSEMKPTPESANKFKDADSVIDQRASRPDSTESTGSKDVDEQSSDLNQVSGEQAKTEAKLKVEPTPELCNKLKDEESLVGHSTTNQISTFSTVIDESTSIIQLDGSNVNNVPDKPAQTEATSDMETTSVVASQFKDVNSAIDKRTLKPDSTDPIVTGESIDSKDIDESSLDLKEVSEKPVLDQNTANQKSTCYQDNDKSLSNIPLDVSDVNSLPDEQSLIKETSDMQFTAKSANELEDGGTVLNQNATKPEYTDSTVVDETKSNLNDVTDKQTQAKAISDKEPIHESNQLKSADSALDQTMLDTLCSPDINKSTTNSKDLSNEQPESEQASKMEQTIDSSKESKDAVITQGAVEPLSTVITDTDELTSKIQSDVNDLPSNQVPTEAKLEINTTSESSTESKDAESVIDQTATNPESTCTTVNDESDEKDKHEKDALTQTTPQTKLTTASSNKMKDQTDMEQNKEKPESLGSEDNNESVSKQQIEGSENKDFLVDPALAHVTSETDSTPRSSSEETSYTDTFETLSDGQTTQESRFQTSQTSGKVTSQISGDMKESATTELRRSSLSDLEELPLE